MLLQDISQIDPLPRHPVRNHRVRDQEPNPVRGWDGKPEVIALGADTLKSDRPSKLASRNVARLVTVKSACVKSPHRSGVAGHLPTYSSLYSSSSPRLSLTFEALTTLSRADCQFGWWQGNREAAERKILLVAEAGLEPTRPLPRQP